MSSTYTPYLQIPPLLNIKIDDTLVVASDITKLALTTMRAEKLFNASQFIKALQQQVSNGTLLFPAFVNGLKSGHTFDEKNSLPQTGTLAVTAFKNNDFVRTTDPFHSFMVWGKHGRQLSNLKNNSTFGSNSVFAFLHTIKGKMLLIDIDLQHSFTFAHYVEELENVKYRTFKTYNINCIYNNGVNETRDILFFEKQKGVTLNLNGLYTLFKQNGALTEYKINGSLFTLIDFEKSAQIIKNDIMLNKAKNLHSFSYALWIKMIAKKLTHKK